MSITANDIITKIQSLIIATNKITGQIDVDLTEAVNALIEGWTIDYDGNIIVEEISSVNFTIDDISYQAEVNMAWGEWVTTDYNTGGFEDVNGRIVQDNRVLDDIVDSTEYIVNGKDYVTVEQEAEDTDLTNTTWYVPSGWSATAGYGKFKLDGELNGLTLINGEDGSIGIGWTNDGVFIQADPDVIGYYAIIHEGGSRNIYNRDGFTLTFTGGTDVTNADLIAWLTTYGIQLKVTDLTNTTWTVNAGWEAEAGSGEYSIDYDIDNNKELSQTIYIGYEYMSDKTLHVYPNYITNGATWEVSNEQSFTIAISGGTDVTDPSLIAWFSQYGELQSVEESDL